MEASRFGSPACVLLPQPRPGERETRLFIPRDRSMQRPREETTRHV